MGMYDTIHFEKQFLCPLCKGKIQSIQVKEFGNSLERFHIKDCVGHAEDIRIIKDELFCNNCLKHTGKNIYIVVNRGILVGIGETLEEGKRFLNELNLEKLILWYHDQYNRYEKERSKKNYYRNFLLDLRKWYGERVYEKHLTGLETLGFTENSSFLKGSKDPIGAIESFLSYDQMKEALDDLWNEGHEILDIYYPEDMSSGEEKWSVDVFQDEINERCHMNWTWTVINRQAFEEEEEKEDEMPEWEILVDGPFSEDVVIKAVEKWLRDRDYKFGVRMIQIGDAKGSGMVKELRDRIKNNEEFFVRLEDIKNEEDIKNAEDIKNGEDIQNGED